MTKWTCAMCGARIPNSLVECQACVARAKIAWAKHDAEALGGQKFDTDKVRMDLFPSAAIEEISKVLTFGAKKYASWNWAKGIAYSRLLGAAFRHLFAYARGEDKDPESGLSHLAHAGCCISFLIWMEKFRADLDDRFKDPATKPSQKEESKNGI